ncbi:MAG: hypothetical protein LC126_22630 [Bryobacterales bacterium]|nr:hypothetical protein [Bryobacterales bacterium]
MSVTNTPLNKQQNPTLKPRERSVLLRSALVALILPLSADAASIGGRVLDTTNTAVSGVTLNLLNAGCEPIQNQQDGAYVFPNLTNALTTL